MCFDDLQMLKIRNLWNRYFSVQTSSNITYTVIHWRQMCPIKLYICSAVCSSSLIITSSTMPYDVHLLKTQECYQFCCLYCINSLWKHIMMLNSMCNFRTLKCKISLEIGNFGRKMYYSYFTSMVFFAILNSDCWQVWA
jgi:hypothetical protein